MRVMTESSITPVNLPKSFLRWKLDLMSPDEIRYSYKSSTGMTLYVVFTFRARWVMTTLSVKDNAGSYPSMSLTTVRRSNIGDRLGYVADFMDDISRAGGVAGSAMDKFIDEFEKLVSNPAAVISQLMFGNASIASDADKALSKLERAFKELASELGDVYSDAPKLM